MKHIVSLMVFAALLGLTYAGVFLGIDGALYVVRFAIWALLLPLAALMVPTVVQERIAEGSPIDMTIAGRVRRRLVNVVYVTVIAMLVWGGHVFTAAALLLAMVFFAVAREGVKTLQEEKAAAA